MVEQCKDCPKHSTCIKLMRCFNDFVEYIGDDYIPDDQLATDFGDLADSGEMNE